MRWKSRSSSRWKRRFALSPIRCDECGNLVWFEWIYKRNFVTRFGGQTSIVCEECALLLDLHYIYSTKEKENAS